jgi:hypothetical protein
MVVAERMRRKRRKSMKKQILAVAAALAFTTLAPAQSHAQQITQAEIPFAFQVGNTMLPAGEYHVQRALSNTKTVELIRRTDSSASLFVNTNGVETSDKDVQPKLIFHCYTHECFLSEIWTGSGQGRKLVESSREKDLSRAKAENELAVVTVPLTVTP